MAKKSKDINFADFQYISTSTAKKGGVKHLNGKLRYFTYRNDKSDHVPHPRNKPRPERWRDRGLGKQYHDIQKNCEALQSADVLAWTWVISPSPELMLLVPEADKRDLVCAVTEQIVTEYYEARGVDVPPYSYVLHDKDTKSGQEQLHCHVVLPGTVETLLGREPFFNNKRQGHVDLFNQIADMQFAAALDRTIGIQWREQHPDLAQATLLADLKKSGELHETDANEMDRSL